MVGGVPALEQDSIHSLFDKAPLMLVVLLSTTMLLMFLAFGSVVLPIKAAVMSALTLGSTLGILTWIFVDGHFSSWLNFTPTPLMVVLIALVVAVGFGLATDYEVFLVSRMVEARARGMSTAEAIRIGTATTGPPDHRGGVGAGRGRRLVRVLRPGDDEVSGFRSDGRASVGRHRRPDVPGARGDEAARRRLLVGADMDAAPAEPVGARRDSTCPTSASCRRRGPGPSRPAPLPARRSVDTASTARPHASQRRRCAAADPTGCAAAPAAGPRDAPSAAGTTRMPAPGGPSRKRLRRLASRRSRTRRPADRRAPPQGSPAPARGDDREIESWLSDLRGGKTGDPRGAGPTPPPQPSADETRALQIPRDQPSGPPPAEPADATTAIPTPPRESNDPDAATEKMNARRRERRPAAAALRRGQRARICCAAKGACSGQFGSGYELSDSSSSGSTCMIEPSSSSVSSAAASGSLASNTWKALLKNATVGTDSSAPTIAGEHAAGRDRHHHRQRMNRHRPAHHQRLQEWASSWFTATSRPSVISA